MRTKQFKAESKRLLDLMINSIYTHKEIFLRELISNASDAIDKLYYQSLSGQAEGLNRDDFAIDIRVDKENRNLIIRDNGCGMARDDLENNLGTIAKSGSLAFKQEQAAKEGKDEKDEKIDIIGQFGVGFYSAFMVSDCVTVNSRAAGSDEAWCWQSKGADGYTLEPCDKADRGTEIILHIKPATEEENYDEFLDSYRLEGIVKKYSDYIRYPIRMEMEHSRLKEGSENEYETVTQVETVNSMVPIWKKNKNEVTQEEYNNFYKEKFFDFQDPLRVISSYTEGAATYHALLFIPAKAPFDYYSKEFEKGLQLYANGVLIMDKCPDLLPDCFSFVRGLVDSQDLSLNISREMLQHDRQLSLIAGRLEKKIKGELQAMLGSDREKYETFFQNFGVQLKYGVYSSFGSKADLLQDLLLFRSSHENKMTTLAEYVSRMKEDQKVIYYACGDTPEKIAQLPAAEAVREKGFEILYLTDDVDEFALKALHTYKEKEFRSVTSGDLGLESDEEKEKAKELSEEHQSLFDAMAKALDGKVKGVRLSSRLKTHPVCLAAEGAISLEMEKVLRTMPGENKPKADKYLELNPTHPIFQTLCTLEKENPEKLADYSRLLYDQAMLIEGMPIEDPVAFSTLMCRLMVQ